MSVMLSSSSLTLPSASTVTGLFLSLLIDFRRFPAQDSTTDHTTTPTLPMQFATLAILSSLLGGASAFVPPSPHKVASAIRVNVVDDKTEVREYFNAEGFNRWNKIYSDSDEVNGVQMDIRDGHSQTIEKILNWVKADGDISGKSVCDCGCGVGSLAIPLAQMGALKQMCRCCRAKIVS